MTISTSTSRMTYTGDSSTSTYSYTYKIFNRDDLTVTVRHPTTDVETTLVRNTDYSVTLNSAGTGSITLINASQAWLTAGKLTTAWVLVIRRVMDMVQETDIRNQGVFFPEAHEDAFDYLTMLDLQQQDELNRSLKIPETESSIDPLPNAADRASRFLAFDSSGEPIASSGAPDSVVPVSAFMETVLDDVDASNARATLGAAGFNILIYSGISTDGVTDSTAGIQTAVTAAASTGAILHWPRGNYVTTSNITNFHNVRHTGPGIILRGSDSFYITPTAAITNVIYVATTGNDANDGLSSSQPKLTIQSAIDAWAMYARTSIGLWKIDIAAGTYTEGGVVDSVVSSRQLLIEGKLSAGVPTVIIDGTGAVKTIGLNFNGGVNAKVKNIKCQDFTSSGIAFQNNSVGVIDTCDAANNAFAGFNASEDCIMDIIGVCNIAVPASAKGIRYYRNSTGTLGDATNTVTVDGNATVSDGIEVRDSSQVVCNNGIVVDDCDNYGILVNRNSYIELRTSTISNCAVGLSVQNLSIWANASGVVTLTSNTVDFDYKGFSQKFDPSKHTVNGATGPSVQGISSNYDLLVSSLAATGLQFLTDSAASSINIDFNKTGRVTYALSGTTLRFTVNSSEVARFTTAALQPATDGTYNLGAASFRWGTVYAAVGAINTSDERHKQDIASIDERALKAWGKVEYCQFKFKDAVKKKGSAARAHVGLIAQKVKEAFESEGLDPFEYGILCYDSWDASPEVLDEEGNVVEVAREAGEIYGIRYEEALALECAYLRSKLK